MLFAQRNSVERDHAESFTAKLLDLFLWTEGAMHTTHIDEAQARESLSKAFRPRLAELHRRVEPIGCFAVDDPA